MFHLFIIIPEYDVAMYYYAVFLFLHIFSFTSTLDYKFYAIAADFLKVILGISIIFYQNYSWFGLGQLFVIIFIIYFVLSFYLTCYFYNKNKLLRYAN